MTQHEHGPRVEGWLRDGLDALERPVADPRFRERLKRAFVGAGPVPAALPAPVPRARAWPRAFAGLAAALLLAWILSSGPQPGAHRLRPVDTNPGGLRIDGRELWNESSVFSLAELEAPKDSATLEIDGLCRIELTGGTRVTLSFEPDGRSLRLVLHDGAVRVVTGAGFAPRRLSVRTHEAEIEVLGTAFGVDLIEGQGTCVCCTSGRVVVRDLETGEVHHLAPGSMAFVVQGPGPAMTGPTKPEHAEPVERLRSSW